MIMDAALTEFAAGGYERTTTSAICARAGIGSGTFFHYFPTKSAVLLAILEYGATEEREWFDRQQGRTDASAVIRDWALRAAEELREPRMAGFVTAVGAVAGDADIAAALAADDAVQIEGLRPWVRRALEHGQIRKDLDEDRLLLWLLALMDGFIGRLAASDDRFTADAEGAVYVETIERFLAP